jgi:hypothetical protein
MLELRQFVARGKNLLKQFVQVVARGAQQLQDGGLVPVSGPASAAAVPISEENRRPRTRSLGSSPSRRHMLTLWASMQGLGGGLYFSRVRTVGDERSATFNLK